MNLESWCQKIVKCDFKKGQTVYLKYMYSSYYREYGEIVEGTVKSVGVKFITVGFDNGADDLKFDINNNFHQVDSSAWKLYLNKEEIELEEEYNGLATNIRQAILDHKEFSLDQLKRIKAIMDESK